MAKGTFMADISELGVEIFYRTLEELTFVRSEQPQLFLGIACF